MVTIGGNEHLGLVPQPAKGNRVDDPVAVALEGIALSARSPVILRENPAARS